MIVKMENEYVAVTINSLGAELSSFVLKQDGTEYIWEGDAKYWGRHAPVLFPIVGRLLDNEYHLGDQVYQLTQHGFARDMEFILQEQDEQHVVFELRANKQTLEKYPSSFQLLITYTLQGHELMIDYQVKNQDHTTMYFSIGAHTGFRCPLQAGECFDDYYLEFSERETADKYILENGFISTQTVPVLRNEKVLPLSYELFKEDALVFKGLQSSAVTIKNHKNSKEIMMKFAGFPYHAIWSKPEGGASFICLEPWYGVADQVGERKDFSAKEGIRALIPGQSFACQYSITIS